MTTYDFRYFPKRLSKIDALTRADHHFLEDCDDCYYLGEYTARAGYAHSPTNNLIINLKKPMDRKGTPQWPHKTRAIQNAAAALKSALSSYRTDDLCFIPSPSSKQKNDPLYDDRVAQILRIALGKDIPICEVFESKNSRPAFHDDAARSIAALSANLNIDEDALSKCTKMIAIFDDVITTGCHFKSMKQSLSEKIPDARVIGLFLARRVPNSIDVSAFFAPVAD